MFVWIYTLDYMSKWTSLLDLVYRSRARTCYLRSRGLWGRTWSTGVHLSLDVIETCESHPAPSGRTSSVHANICKCWRLFRGSLACSKLLAGCAIDDTTLMLWSMRATSTWSLSNRPQVQANNRHQYAYTPGPADRHRRRTTLVGDDGTQDDIGIRLKKDLLT